MPTQDKTLIDLETRFWQSMVDHNTDAALSMLNEPAVMVSQHGAISFDHAGYRKMAEQGSQQLRSFELSDVDVVFPNADTAIVTYKVKQEMARRADGQATVQEMNDSSTWIHTGKGWLCAMHTETPMEPMPH